MRAIHNQDGRKMFNGDPQVAESEKADIQVDQAQDAPVSDLEAVTAERDLYLDQLQRSMAEFANYRRRVDQERSQARKLATRDLLLDVVRIADDFKRALAAVPEEDAEAPWLKGISLIERNLTTLLEREGVTPVNAMGQRFDPSMHEAVAVDPGSSATIVTEVFQNGYWHGDQLLRPAIVKVGDAGPEDQQDAEDTRQT